MGILEVKDIIVEIQNLIDEEFCFHVWHSNFKVDHPPTDNNYGLWAKFKKQLLTYPLPLAKKKIKFKKK